MELTFLDGGMGQELLARAGVKPTGLWSAQFVMDMPELAPRAHEAADLFYEIACIQAPYVDMILLETMASVEQARGAVMGALAAGKPVWLAVTVDDADGTRLRSREPLKEILDLVRDPGVEALLVNCSSPEAVTQSILELDCSPVPIGAYANGFVEISADFLKPGATVDVLEKRKDLTPDAYADAAGEWIRNGATIIGGCCEVGPGHIKALCDRFSSVKKT